PGPVSSEKYRFPSGSAHGASSLLKPETTTSHATDNLSRPLGRRREPEQFTGHVVVGLAQARRPEANSRLSFGHLVREAHRADRRTAITERLVDRDHHL